MRRSDPRPLVSRGLPVHPPPRGVETQMTHIVNEAWIKCKLQDCVEVCPVDCFYEGERPPRSDRVPLLNVVFLGGG